MLPKASWIFSFDDKNLQTRLKLVGDHPGGGGRGGHLGIFWVGKCRLGLQIGTPF